MAERLESRLVRGEEISLQEHATLCSSLVRLGARIGIERIAKDITTLADYLAQRRQEQPSLVLEPETADGEVVP